MITYWAYKGGLLVLHEGAKMIATFNGFDFTWVN